MLPWCILYDVSKRFQAFFKWQELTWWSNTADVAYCIYSLEGLWRSCKGALGLMRGHQGPRRHVGVSSTHHIPPCKAYMLHTGHNATDVEQYCWCCYMLFPCGLYTGPVLLTWHINDLKWPKAVYNDQIYTHRPPLRTPQIRRARVYTVSAIKWWACFYLSMHLFGHLEKEILKDGLRC